MTYTLDDESIDHGNGSPGPVLEAEKLLKFIFHPDHITDDGDIAPSAVQSKDLTEPDRGLSVYRTAYADQQVITQNISDQQEKLPDQREFPEFCVVLCGDVRSIVDLEKRRGFLVIDDAVEGNIAHSIIFSAYDRKPSVIKKLRNEICDLLNQGRNTDLNEALTI